MYAQSTNFLGTHTNLDVSLLCVTTQRGLVIASGQWCDPPVPVQAFCAARYGCPRHRLRRLHVLIFACPRCLRRPLKHFLFVVIISMKETFKNILF